MFTQRSSKAARISGQIWNIIILKIQPWFFLNKTGPINESSFGVRCWHVVGIIVRWPTLKQTGIMPCTQWCRRWLLTLQLYLRSQQPKLATCTMSMSSVSLWIMQAFEEHVSKLHGLAYNLLASRAPDQIQRHWLNWNFFKAGFSSDPEWSTLRRSRTCERSASTWVTEFGIITHVNDDRSSPARRRRLRKQETQSPRTGTWTRRTASECGS